MGSSCEGSDVETVGKKKSLHVSSEQNGPGNVDEADLRDPEFYQGKTAELERTLHVGSDTQIHGDSQRQRLHENFVPLNPSAREYTPGYALQTPLIVPPPAPCNFVQPTMGHPFQLVYAAASLISTGVPSPPVAWVPSITLQLLNRVPLETHPVQDDTYYASSVVPVQLNAIRHKHTSRALSLSLVPTDISDTVLRNDLSAWGLIGEMDLFNWPQGLVTVHYYDLRHAQAALTDIQEQHLMQQIKVRDCYQFPHEGQSSGTPISAKGLIGGSVVWAQYTTPFTYQADSLNQGTLVVFNLDSNISMEALRSVFESYGMYCNFNVQLLLFWIV